MHDDAATPTTAPAGPGVAPPAPHTTVPGRAAQPTPHHAVPHGSTPLTTRRAVPEDAEAVAALVQSAYRGDASRAGWTTEADLLDGQRTDPAMVADLIAADGSVVLLGHDDGELVATCHLERRDAEDGEPGCYLGMFAVRPGLQGRGIGRRFLVAAEQHARDAWDARTCDLTVINHRHELIAWYERQGYAMTGEEHPFPYGDERYGIPRRPDLVLLGMRHRLDPADG